MILERLKLLVICLIIYLGYFSFETFNEYKIKHILTVIKNATFKLDKF